jgi:DNA (cytosine-5)-methyltransferase 1
MTHLGLFEGIGGFSLAARWAGWQTVAWCEWNEFGQRVLRHHFPEATGHGDIRSTDFTIYRCRIDIITGGFPCQPYSIAGKRLGKEDERHLWPEMLRAIREVQPRWVVGENVFGLVNWNGGMVFNEVQADLEAEGYEVQPFVLPACAVNAPHRRDRIWFVAKNAKRNGCVQRESEQKGTEVWQFGNTCARSTDGLYQYKDAWPTPHPNSDGRHGSNGQHEVNASQRGVDAQRDVEQVGGDVGNASGLGLEGGILTARAQKQERISGPVKAISEHIHSGRSGLQFQNFPTQPPIRSGDDGVSARLDTITFPKWRNESIKAYGNAIVPQVALQIFQAINEYEQIGSPENQHISGS